MERAFQISIVTPSHLVLEDSKVTKLSVPTKQGEVTLLMNHINLMTELVPGVVKVFYAEKRKPSFYYVESGFLEFFKNKATIIAEVLEASEEVSLVQLQEEEKKAQKTLEDQTTKEEEIQSALQLQGKVRARQALLDLSSQKSSP